jgi:signal transduction protein with GAF and PtsI domain
MTYDPAYRMLTPIDEEAPRRAARMRELGIREEPDQEFDEFARHLAETTHAPFAMVNIIGPQRQYFAGLYPSSAARGVDWQTDPFRVMACDHGYCMHVVTRRHAMALDQVMDYARFAVNPVVDEIGVQAYLGAPLIDRTGMTLGTICVVDTEPHPWGHDGVKWIKAQAAGLVERILERAARPDGFGHAPGAASLPAVRGASPVADE